MPASNRPEARSSSLYSERDYDAINRQITRRKRVMFLPCAVLLALLIFSLAVRVQWLTITCTIAMGVILIAGQDLFIKPLLCYRAHLDNVLYGRAHEVTLPFAALSEDISLVDGVYCRALTCTDMDAKNRPYERLFYLDTLKELPPVAPGEKLLIVHHDLTIVDVTRA